MTINRREWLDCKSAEMQLMLKAFQAEVYNEGFDEGRKSIQPEIRARIEAEVREDFEKKYHQRFAAMQTRINNLEKKLKETN